jgi:hypothetical protein
LFEKHGAEFVDFNELERERTQRQTFLNTMTRKSSKKSVNFLNEHEPLTDDLEKCASQNAGTFRDPKNHSDPFHDAQPTAGPFWSRKSLKTTATT